MFDISFCVLRNLHEIDTFIKKIIIMIIIIKKEEKNFYDVRQSLCSSTIFMISLN